MEYYDLKKHWRKVKRHLDHPEVQKKPEWEGMTAC